MKILYFEQPIKEVILVPRRDILEDEILTVKMKNELTNKYSDINNTYTYEFNYLTLSLEDSVEPDFFINNSKYEIEISIAGKIVYKGNCKIVSENTPIQDYKTTHIIGDKLKF